MTGSNGNGKPDNGYLFQDPDHGPINVTLDRFERRLAKNLAKERQNWCVRMNVMDQKKAAKLSGVLITEEGTAAEIAFAKVFNLCPDFSVCQFSKFDFVLVSGLRVDAKQSGNKRGNLIVKAATKRNGTDLFALVLGSDQTNFSIWGYAWAGDLLRPENLDMTLPVPGYRMRRADLLDPRDLFNPDPSALKARRLALKAIGALN